MNKLQPTAVRRVAALLKSQYKQAKAYLVFTGTLLLFTLYSLMQITIYVNVVISPFNMWSRQTLHVNEYTKWFPACSYVIPQNDSEQAKTND